MQQFAPRRPRLRSAALAGGLALGLSLLAAAGPALAEPTVSSVTVTATPTVEIGETVDVSVDLADVVDAYSYAITVAFDATKFEYVEDSASTGPAGGFDTVELGDGTVTILHSRLGTSPSISGDMPATLSFTTIDSGDATIAASASIVDATGLATSSAAETPAAVTITALPIIVPPTDPTVPTDGTGTTPADTTTTATPTGSLAFTGFSGALLLFVALVVAGIGVTFVVLRRRTVSAR